MKRIIAIVLLLFTIGACQQQQEPKGQLPHAGAPLQMPQQNAQEIALLQDAVRKDPGNVTAWIQLGNIMMDTSRFSEAVDAYQKALAIDPRNVDVRVDMATCYRGMGNSAKAVEEYRKAIEINPKHPYAHRNLGVTLLFDLKDKTGAAKEFEKYLELSPFAQDASQIRQTLKELKAGK